MVSRALPFTLAIHSEPETGSWDDVHSLVRRSDRLCETFDRGRDETGEAIMNALLILVVAGTISGKVRYEFDGVVETTSAEYPENIRNIEVGDEVFGEFTIDLGTRGIPFVNDPEGRITYLGAVIDFDVTVGDSFFTMSATSISGAAVDISGTEYVSLGCGISDEFDDRVGIFFIVDTDTDTRILPNTSLLVFEDLYLLNPIFRINFHGEEFVDPDPNVRIELQTLLRPFVADQWNGRVPRPDKRAVPEPSSLFMFAIGLLEFAKRIR